LKGERLNVNEWAKMILSSESLADKLYSPDSFVDSASSGRFEIPATPARPENLRFGSKKRTFPSAFDQASTRGLALHYFANHELLAMELMALALLRFEEAPPGFREGIVRTILEEQSHLRLYLGRMNELGVEFGDLSVNGFFWATISSMKTPMDYIVRMSLTFEQANLDHAAFFKQEFLRFGDETTSALMEKVYQEEIGHVKFGVSWFEALRPKENTFWAEYESQLDLPLSPSRAKGKNFSVPARQQAGLSEHFIRELEVYARSKGRLPVVYEFNPACEEVLKHPGYQKTGFVSQLETDLSSLLMFVARPGDMILVSKLPSTDFVAYWKAKGLEPIEFVTKVPKDRKIQGLHPWGKTPKHPEDSLGVKRGTEFLFGKDFGAELDDKVRSQLKSVWIEPECPKQLLSSPESILKHLKFLSSLGFTEFVLKARYGASGRGLKKLRDQEIESTEVSAWILHQLPFGPIVVEPWYVRIADFSLQLDLRGDKPRGLKGVTRLLTSKTGQYEGHILRGLFADLPATVLKKIYSDDLMGVFSEIAVHVSSELRKHNFNGVAGIDLFLYESKDEIYLRPVCELNPRMTMGFVALEIEKYLKMGTPMLWRHERVDKLPPELLEALKSGSNPGIIPTSGVDLGTRNATWLEPLIGGGSLS
jgi:uncharacterized ferritin-like protein (DUF455 family)